jgi:ABC-type dipeptide/oligopeptide/nickel transport system ATPase component
MQETILQVEDLSVYFALREGLLKAVTHVSFEICRGETLGLVGESGCGKTVSSLAIIGLLDTHPP